MSAERELLKKILATRWLDHQLSCEVEELLAKPEPEPVEERIARWHRLGYEQGKKASKREPLTPQQISEGNQSMFNVTREAFVKGIKFAEKAHGIGVDDE
jgi:hypothetical protein